jgi:DNA-binding YbaB/EbfC family protein
MLFNLMDLLKNPQKFQEQMGSIQQKMEDVFGTGCSGGGMVEIDINGRMEVTGVRIEPQILKPENSKMVEDLIQSAFSDAVEKIRGALNAQMGRFVAEISAKG